MKKRPKKDYYRLEELADEWNCAVEDIHHHFLHDRIKIGVRVHNDVLYGLNAHAQTIGAYSVSGVLTIPKVCAEGWEFAATGITEAGGFLAESDYPPEIVEASYMDESSFSRSFFRWAPGRDWQHPETDHSRIDHFAVGDRGVDEAGETAARLAVNRPVEAGCPRHRAGTFSTRAAARRYRAEG
jgi:hypothetical protein